MSPITGENIKKRLQKINDAESVQWKYVNIYPKLKYHRAWYLDMNWVGTYENTDIYQITNSE